MKFCLRELRIAEDKFINANYYREFPLPRLQNELTSAEQPSSFLRRFALSSTEQQNHIGRGLWWLNFVTRAEDRQSRLQIPLLH
jgi:hypothetical protein